MASILITGITGNQGGSVLNALKDSSIDVYGLTRNLNSKKAKKLSKRGIKLIEGDLGKPETLKDIHKYADFVFFVTDFWAGKDNEIKYGKNLVAAVKDHCKHFIFSSTPSSNKDNLFAFSDSKYQIEQFIKESNMRYSIVRPGLFMELFSNFEFVPPVILGMMMKHIDNDKKLPFVSVKDIGKVIAKIIHSSDEFINSDFNVITSMTSLNEFRDTHKKVRGWKPLRFALPNKIFGKYVSKDLFGLWHWLNNDPLKLTSEEYHKIHPSAITFDRWLKKV